MNQPLGTTGLIMNEPLLWERGARGRCGVSIPDPDTPSAPVDNELAGQGPDFPDLCEVDVVRHYTRLSQWNFGVDTGMYPLGSCTMKYNPKINEKISALPGFAGAHPLQPAELSQGTLRLMYELEGFLNEITGMDATTLQPAAGAHGELTAMLLFDAFHRKNGRKRTKILIPDTAHGTNPASAALCGFQTIPVVSGPDGVLTADSIDRLMDEDTVGVMATNPNTLGLFEDNIKQVADLVHERGGLVYCDGANLNAIMGIVKMGDIGIDAVHLNLHKTFSTPHGGGGPGSGPVCVKKELAPFLPVPRVIHDNGVYRLEYGFSDSIGKIHAFYGNFGILVRAYGYILSMGAQLKTASQNAVLSANYIKEKLKDVFHLPYDRPCMHECVFTDKYQESNKVTTLDIAKRLMDYGFHPPTVYFPLVVHGAIMIEPTDTESRENIDQFIEALRMIAKEAKENPDLVRNTPNAPKVRRLDETAAARKPCLSG